MVARASRVPRRLDAGLRGTGALPFAVALLAALASLAAPAPAAAQCDACEKPAVMAVLKVVVPADHASLGRLDQGQGAEDSRARVARALQLQLKDEFGGECVEVNTQGDVRWVLAEAAREMLSGVDDRGDDVDADDLGQDEVRQAAAMTGAPYILAITVSAAGAGAHASAALINQETMATYARETASSSGSVSSASALTSALANLAARLDLWDAIRRAETPVSAELVADPEAVDVGDVATLRVDRLLNADGADVRSVLEDRTRLAVRLTDDGGRWRLTGAPLEDDWRQLGERGSLEARSQSPGSCRQDDEHPLTVGLEVAPACWRGPPRRNGDPIASGEVRARCQLAVEVDPDETTLEPGGNTAVHIYVKDHRGRSPDEDSKVAIQTQRLRLGAVSPSTGTARGGSPGAAFTADYAAKDDADEGTDVLAATATASDEWGDRRGEGEAAVEVGVGRWWLMIDHQAADLIVLAVAEHEGPLEGEWDLTTIQRGGLFKTDCAVNTYTTDESVMAMTLERAGPDRWTVHGDLSFPDGRMVKAGQDRYEITFDWEVLCDRLDWDSHCGTTPVRAVVSRTRPARFDGVRRQVGAALRAGLGDDLPVFPAACPPDEGD